MLKKLGLFTMIFATLLVFTGCGAEKAKEEGKEEEKVQNVEGTLEEIMTKVYADIPEEERPMMLMNTVVNEENVEYFLGTTDIEYKEALASEPGVGSIPHSVVLVRVNEGADVEAIKTKIKESVNPRKWICVEAENVIVKSKGDLIILIMTTDGADKLETAFDNL